MKKNNKYFLKFSLLITFSLLATGALYVWFVQNQHISAQTKQTEKASKVSTPEKTGTAELSVIKQIDPAGYQELIKRNENKQKPLLVNFWATWCAPCRVEFPELVKIDTDYQGQIDFVTVSLDDVSEIDTRVPEFLAQNKAKMPTFLLKADDEEAAIKSISKDWQGGLPFTVLYNEKGEIVFSHQGLINPEQVREQIKKSLTQK